ncbi:hypothetical protein IC762_10115 [Bradyrhizobium genosp. L]|nr:hypothetical protein [Bradyrhizobium genosp. L]QPF86604.1 hypothetical protein IC762_10115 [Bradyrhizobium genosp. L]
MIRPLVAAALALADEHRTIDLYDRQKINAADIVDRSFGAAVETGAGL